MSVVLATGTTDHDTEVIPLITVLSELTVAAVTTCPTAGIYESTAIVARPRLVRSKFRLFTISTYLLRRTFWPTVVFVQVKLTNKYHLTIIALNFDRSSKTANIFI